MIDPLASVHPSAIIGKDVKIDAFAYVAEDVAIGDNTWIAANSTIMDGARIGQSCRVFPGAVISAEPQDLKYQGESTTVTIGNNTTIRECVTINKGTRLDRGDTLIGDHTMIMAYSHIAHDCVIGNHVILANGVQMGGHVIIEDYAFIGGTTAIHQYVHIGSHSMISGGSLVKKDVPPFITAAREPLSYLGINVIGLKRRGYTSEKIHELQEIYRVLYLKGMSNSDAFEMLKSNFEATEERDNLLAFAEKSRRGLIGYTKDQ